MNEAQAEALAAAEGLELIRNPHSSTGWKFVFGCAKPDKPYQAKLKVSTGPNKCFQEHLGYFGSAPEAALAVARRLGPAGLSGLKRKRD